MRPRDDAGSRRALFGTLLLAWIVPALLVSCGLYLRIERVVEELRAGAARELSGVLAQAVARWRERLSAPGLEGVLTLQWDGDTGAWRPFAPWRDTGANDAAPSFVLELAVEAAQRGDAEAALRFFEHARTDASATWTGEAHLAHARCLAALGRRSEARALLAPHSTGTTPTSGPLDLGVLAALLDARLAAADGDLEPARSLRDRLLSGALPLPAAAVEPALELLDELHLEPDARRVVVLAAAKTVRAIEDGAALAATPAVIEGSAWIQPIDGTTARILSLELVEQELVAALERAEQEHPELVLAPLAKGVEGEVLQEIAGTSFTASASLRDTPPSVWVERLELGLYALALLVFAATHALAFRLAWRETRLARLKSEFVDRVSHELRTPLTAAALQAEMLASGRVPPEKLARYHRGLRAEIERLSQLVQRVLDFARLSRGKMPFEPRAVPLRSVLARGLRAGRHALRLARQKIAVRAPRDLPALTLDPALLETALANLLENCARHAPKGSEIELEVARERDSWVFAVLDRGPGVPVAERAVIFEAFRRGAAASARPGSGLGLALVREAARLHGGTAEFEERTGGGSIFRLRLPLREVDAR